MRIKVNKIHEHKFQSVRCPDCGNMSLSSYFQYNGGEAIKCSICKHFKVLNKLVVTII